MNKAKIPKISPILTYNKFIINCKDKANLFVNFFSIQCKPLNNDSFLPNFTFLSDARIDSICITTAELISLIRGLNEEKGNGPEDIAAHMLIICDDTFCFL